MIALALIVLCSSLVVSTILCQYNLKLDSRSSLSSAFCSFLFFLKSCIFSCCLAFHCSTWAFSFFNCFTISCSSLILSFSLPTLTLNYGNSFTGAGWFRSIAAWGFLNLIWYLEVTQSCELHHQCYLNPWSLEDMESDPVLHKDHLGHQKQHLYL